MPAEARTNDTDSTAVATVRPNQRWHIVLTRMVYDPRTTEYIERRKREALTKKEAVRCLSSATWPERSTGS